MTGLWCASEAKRQSTPVKNSHRRFATEPTPLMTLGSVTGKDMRNSVFNLKKWHRARRFGAFSLCHNSLPATVW